MTLWLQNLLVLVAVCGCSGFVLWQSVQSLRGKKSKVGSCCAKGCSDTAKAKPPAGQRIVFMPAELLARRK